ncbi:hypothetical protein [Plantibacter flavus]|uniref:hypothetical protein n=1 Tax=Plantibacter flavus TaxID=150123 RepID=UPI00129479F8|nr:hypothetical protein [Plantibacter flavus]
MPDADQLPEAVMTTVSELRALEDGFLGPGSVAPKTEVLGKLLMVGADLAGRQVVPSWGGGVMIEWARHGCEFTAEIESNGQLFLCVDNTETDELAEVERPFAVAELKQFLQHGSWND